MSSLVWSAQRPFLRHGKLAWVTLAVSLLLGMQAVQVCASAIHLARQADKPLLVAAIEPPARQVVPILSLPQYQQRFELTREAIAAAAGESSTPIKISFGYQTIAEARLMRQTATFAKQSSWNELGQLLDRLQGVNRAAYISRLRLSRDQVSQPEVEAEVQVAIAYFGTPASESE